MRLSVIKSIAMVAWVLALSRAPSAGGGPCLVKDIDLAPRGRFSCSEQTSNGGRGQELWRSDGTAAGAFIVKEIVPGPDGSVLQFLTGVAESLLFWPVNNVHHLGLWMSDPTPAGRYSLALN